MSEDYKQCPFCQRLILGDAKVCKHCGANLVGNGKISSEANSDLSNLELKNDNINFIQGLTYMFSNHKNIIKFLGFYLLCLTIMLINKTFVFVTFDIDLSLLKFLASRILLNAMILGYSISCVKDITTQSEQYNLPTIKFLNNFEH